MDYICHYASPLGMMTIASRDNSQAISGLWFDGQRHYGSTLTANPQHRQLQIFALACQWLDQYFSGRQPAPELPLLLLGTSFQCRVWTLLQTIPYASTTTYGTLAAQLTGDHHPPRMTARALGGAVGRNPIALLIPCHRVLGHDGALTGYAGGLPRKQWLLRLEHQSCLPDHSAP